MNHAIHSQNVVAATTTDRDRLQDLFFQIEQICLTENLSNAGWEAAQRSLHQIETMSISLFGALPPVDVPEQIEDYSEDVVILPA